MDKVTESWFRMHFPEREKDSHKGTYGRVLIFAGSTGMAGAAVLAGRAALRSGAGLVRFLLPSFEAPIYPILQTAVPEATCVTAKALADPDEYDAIAAGSGLGKEAEQGQILYDLISQYHGKLVLDADALNMIARDPLLAETVREASAEIVLTPHIKEAQRLLKTEEGIRSQKERREAALALSEEYHCAALLKGAGTLICSAEKELLINETGNPGMATGGSGDVLSGIIAAFAGQGLRIFDAAACGAYIHGRAGDEAAAALGEVCMNAGDIVSFLPKAWQF